MATKPKKSVPVEVPPEVEAAESAAVAALELDNREVRAAASEDPAQQAFGEEHALLRRALGESESEATTLRVEAEGLRSKLLDVTAELRRQEREVSKLQGALKEVETVNAAHRAELAAIDDVIGTDGLVLIECKIARPASIRQLQVRKGGMGSGSTHFAFKLDDKAEPVAPPPAPVVVTPTIAPDDDMIIRRNLSYILGIAPSDDTAVGMAIQCNRRARAG